MESHVGARMETVAPKRVVKGGDAIRLMVLVTLAVIVHAWLIAHTAVPARDAIGFARQAYQFTHPNALHTATGIEGIPGIIREPHQPPGYTMSVLAAWGGLKFIQGTPTTPEQLLLATQIASGLAAVLLVVPLYLLGRMTFGRFAGFAATALFIVLPVPAHITSDGLTEALYLLAAITSLGCGMAAVRRKSTAYSLAAGLGAGAAYLVRPEGLIFIPAAFATVVVGLTITRRWTVSVALGRSTAFATGALLMAIPYILLIGGFSNKTTATELWNEMKGNPREQLWKGDIGRLQPGTELFAAWYVPSVAPKKPIWAAQAVFSETTKAFHYVPAGYAILGLAMFRRRIVQDPGFAMLAILFVLNVLALYGLALKNGYVSERHAVLLVAVGCIFAAGSLEPLARLVVPRWPARTVAGVTLLILACTALPATFRTLHENRQGHYYAGKYLGTVVTAEDVVIDPFCWAEFYSGRSLLYIPKDPPQAKVIYTILEQGSTNHSRLVRIEVANEFAAKGRVVYQWPEDVPADKAKVVVYKTIRP